MNPSSIVLASRQEIPRYSADESCVQFRDWTGGRSVSTVGTNAGTDLLPFQTWRRFKEAFAPELIERAVAETPSRVRHIVDPFGGSGTTALAAQFLGTLPTTIEVNPYLADLIEAKLAPIDFSRAIELYRHIVEDVTESSMESSPVFNGAPATFVEPGKDGRYVFSQEVAGRILAYRAAIERVSDPTHRRLFRVVLGSTAVPSSNVVVSGKGRRYRMGWKERRHSSHSVDDLFRSKLLQALHDLRKFAARRCLHYRILRGDARELADQIGPYDLAVFSPPYPNSFDYTDVYNVELWTLGYLDSAGANTRLRHSTLSSHVQLIRRFEPGSLQSPTLKRTLDALAGVRNKLWSQHIPEMIGAYAHDMEIVMRKLAGGVRSRGRIYIVVGDSRYAGVVVPASTIISEIAQSIGFKLVGLESCRAMRTSPQQGGEFDLAETLLIMEWP